MFYQGGTIDHCNNVTGPVAQYSAEIEYTKACTIAIALSHFRILNNYFMNKDLDVVP